MAKALAVSRARGDLVVPFICKGVYMGDISGEWKHCKAITFSAYGRCATCVSCSARGGGYLHKITPAFGGNESPGWRIQKCECKEICKCKVPPPVLPKYIVCQK